MRSRRRLRHVYFVYILECSDGSYYTGVTNNVERRLWEHAHPTNAFSYTASRLPIVLRWSDMFRFVKDAINFEKQLKGWSRRKKEALFSGDWVRIRELAKRNDQRF